MRCDRFIFTKVIMCIVKRQSYHYSIQKIFVNDQRADVFSVKLNPKTFFKGIE